MSNNNAQLLAGKIAIVTGAQAGIGLATARAMAANGAKVVLADLPDSTVAESAKKVAEVGEAVHCPVDISREDSVRELMEFTLDTYGRLDVVDNNAARQGSTSDADILSMDPDMWDGIFAVNTRGTMLMCKHAVAAMLKSGGGAIVNISSGTSLAGQLYQSAYACSKGAINTLTKYVATQYGDQGIRCNALTLGLVKTEMLAKTMPEDFQQLMVENKLSGRLGTPEEVAEIVTFMASDRAAWITGQVFGIDGGYFAHAPQLATERRLMAESGKTVGS